MEIRCRKLLGRKSNDDHDTTCCKILKLTHRGGKAEFKNTLKIVLELCILKGHEAT